MVQRFDLTAGARRIHLEDFAQVFGMFSDDKVEEPVRTSLGLAGGSAGPTKSIEFLLTFCGPQAHSGREFR